MKGSIGCPTRIITRVPRMRELAKGESKELSDKAKFRLKVFDWYYKQSARFSVSGLPDASLTCRHFGIYRSMFYRWMKRYDKTRLSSLENRITAPAKRRATSYSRDLVNRVREIRKADPTYSGNKIRPILLREMDEAAVPGTATLGRLISRENLFFRADAKRHKSA